jgi:hypothetical protein
LKEARAASALGVGAVACGAGDHVEFAAGVDGFGFAFHGILKIRPAAALCFVLSGEGQGEGQGEPKNQLSHFYLKYSMAGEGTKGRHEVRETAGAASEWLGAAFGGELWRRNVRRERRMADHNG